jgi:predicted nucleic-acid-binding Zn-ribbon protein
MSRKTSLVTVGPDRHPLNCLVCRGNLFFDREIKLNTSGAEFFNLGWANQSATGLVCERCGYVHTFVSDIELWDPRVDTRTGSRVLSGASATSTAKVRVSRVCRW